MGTFGDSWSLTKTAFRTVREDTALLVFPLVSGLSAIGIIVLFALGLFSLNFFLSPWSNAYDAVVVVLALVVYFLLSIVSVYFTGALIGASMMKLNGGQPTFHDGMAAARAHAGKLVAWALIAATVLLLIRIAANAISRRGGNLLGAIVGLGAGIAWGILTYFIVPVLMFEQATAWQSLKRSGSLFSQTFGKTFISNLALGLILAGGFILAIVLIVVGVWLAFSVSVALGLVVALAGIAFLVFMVILSSAVEGVLVTALYRFATTGQVAPGLVPPAYANAMTSRPPGAYPGPLPSSYGQPLP